MIEAMLKNKWNIILTFSFGLTTLFMFCAKLSDLYTDITVAIWVSFLFYGLVTAVPNYWHKKAQKDAFFAFYRQFKEDVIRELLQLIDYHENDSCDLQMRLLDTKEFRNFFKQVSNIPGQSYRDVLLNAVADSENKYSVEIISELCHQLEREVDFLARTLMISDTNSLKKLRHISRLMGDGRLSSDIDSNQEDESLFVDALFGIFSGWDIVAGETGDFIKELVDKM